jgi:hypothetical protein
VFNLDDQEAREVRGNPFLIEGIGLLLLDAVVAGQMEALRIIGFEIRIRGRGAESGNVVGIMSVKDHQGITHGRMRIESLGQQNVRAKKYVASPKTRQQFTANADVPNELGIRFRHNALDFLVEQQREFCGMRLIQVQDSRRRIQVAGLFGPLLTFALIGRQFQNTPIRKMISFITIEYGLHKIVAGGKR